MSRSIDEFPLREKKYAKTKIALSREFMSRMKTTRFADISVKEVCESVEVSEGTFYNYFPHKTEIVRYFNQLSLLKLMWEIRLKREKLNSICMIEYAFNFIAEDIQDPFLFYEIISLFASEHANKREGEDLTPAEKIYGVPDCPGIEEFRVVSLHDFLTQLVADARKNKEIDLTLPSGEIVLSLMSVLIGVPLAIETKDFGKLKKLYKNQLSILWKALNVKKRK